MERFLFRLLTISSLGDRIVLEVGMSAGVLAEGLFHWLFYCQTPQPIAYYTRRTNSSTLDAVEA